jgi:hypothetical protein
MPITSGSYTVGSGGTYATWDLALADLASPLTGNVTFTQISDVTLTTGAALSITSLAGYTVLCTSNTPHYGDPTKGWWTYIQGITAFTNSGGNVPGVFELANLKLSRITRITTGLYHFYNNQAYAYTDRIHDCIFLDNATSLTSTAGNIIGGVTGGTNNIWQIYNCYLYDTITNACQTGRASTATYVENVTAYNATLRGTAFTTGSNGIFRQCAAFNYSTCFATAGHQTNDASSDATGTGTFINLTTANELVDLSPAQPDFLDIKANSRIYQGLAPGSSSYLAGHTRDIRTRNIPNNRGFHSMGASTAWPNQCSTMIA